MTAITAPPMAAALNALLNLGMDLLGRIRAAIAGNDTRHIPQRFAANPSAAEARVTRTLDWVFALCRTLAGDAFYRRPETPPPTSTPRLRATQASPPPTEAAREARRAAARLRYMRLVFATVPTNRIARRLALRLGLAPHRTGWPHSLADITETPAAYADRIAPPLQTPPSPPPPAPPRLRRSVPPRSAAPLAGARRTPDQPPASTAGSNAHPAAPGGPHEACAEREIGDAHSRHPS